VSSYTQTYRIACTIRTHFGWSRFDAQASEIPDEVAEASQST